MKAYDLYNEYVGRVAALLVGVVVLCLCLYIAFLLGAVSHAAGRTQAERSVQSLSVQVGALENQYLSQTRAISPERAAALGFVAPAAVSAVYADAVPALTLR